jgi:hypothetical protein
MADVRDPQQEEKLAGNANKATIPAESQEIQRLSDTSTMGSASQPQGFQAAQQKAPAQQGSAAGQRFRNLKAYVGKSKSNLAGYVGGQLKEKENIVGQQIQKSQEQLGKDVTAAKERAGSAETAYAIPQTGTPATEQVPVTPAPTTSSILAGGAASITADPTKAKEFSGLLAGVNPNIQVGKAEELAKSVGGIKESAQNLGTEQGRFATLQQTLGAGRGYSQGAQALDQLLLQTQKPQVQQLKELRGTLGQVSSKQLEGLQQEAGTAATELGGRFGQISASLKEGLKGAQGQITDAAKQRLAEFKATPEYQAMTTAGLTDAEILNSLSKKLGPAGKPLMLNEESKNLFKNLYGLSQTDIQNLLNEDKANLAKIGSAKGMATAEEQANLAALSQLGGKEVPLITPEGIEGVSNAQDLKRAALDKVTQAVVTRKKEYDTASKNLQTKTMQADLNRTLELDKYKTAGNMNWSMLDIADKMGYGVKGKATNKSDGINYNNAARGLVANKGAADIKPFFDMLESTDFYKNNPGTPEQKVAHFLRNGAPGMSSWYDQTTFNPTVKSIQDETKTLTEQFTRR